MLDAEASLAALRARSDIDMHSIFVFGRSLGGAVAIALAHRMPDSLCGIIVENTFLNIASMVDHLMPLVGWAKALVLRIGWDNALLVQKLVHPMMFVVGSKDELVPPTHMQALHDGATKAKFKEWHAVLNGTHNDTWLRGGDAYYQALQAFINKVLQKEQVCGKGERHVETAGIPTMSDQPLRYRLQGE